MSTTREGARLLLLFTALLGTAALAQSPATFALIIGVNKSVDPELKPLRYADDDAARWQELFRTLGASTWIMARLDENTSRLHPQAAAEAVEPIDAQLDPLVARVRTALEQARANQVPTTLYVVYAGHGNVRGGSGYLALEDARLSTDDLVTRLFDRLPAERTHLIADACFSSFLAYSRGPGGTRQDAKGFSANARLSKVGLLLSTSSARESHEWEGFQAGVFSHEVRSGLHGAADADADGRVSYRELAAFVQRANASITNEKYRPDIFALPADGDELIDLRRALDDTLDVEATQGAHYFLEDSRGVRLADFHNAQRVQLLRPASGGALYLHRLGAEEQEFRLPLRGGTVKLTALPANQPRVSSRGAANDAFASAFQLGFDSAAVAAWQGPKVVDEPTPWRPLGITSVVLGQLTLLAGITSTTLANERRARVALDASQLSVAMTNDFIETANALAIAGYVATGLFSALGVGLLWGAPDHTTVTVFPGGVRGSF